MLSPISENRLDRSDPEDGGRDSQHEKQRRRACVAKVLGADVSHDAADHQQGQSDRGSDPKRWDDKSGGQSQGASNLQRTDHAPQLRTDV